MEVKKSSTANLENMRGQRLLLGLVLSLACCFVALEHTIEPDDPLDDPELIARLESEMELPPMLQQENELMLAPKAEPKPETKLVVVEEQQEADLLKALDELMETDVDDDMEAIDDEELPEPPKPDEEEAKDLRVLQDMPQFPGGPREFMKWLTRNMKYPKSLEAQKVQGRVVAEFIVEKDGSVTNVKVTQSLNALCDAEVLRVLRMMPRWTAGIDNGQPCRTKVCIPVMFRY